jgi:lysophospholipase L1-like esterase
VMWVVHRKLPSLDGHDASATVPGGNGDRPLRLVLLGDSTLTGPGLEGPHQVWLHRALAELELDIPVDVVSLAVGGSRVADVRRRVAEAIDERPDVVIVGVGSNDAIHGTPTRRFAVDLDGLIGDRLAEVPVVAVCNVGDLGNLARVPFPLTSVLRRRSATICRTIESVTARHPGAVLLDVTGSNLGFRDRSVFGADLFHPNDAGHALWASAAVPGLRSALAGSRSREVTIESGPHGPAASRDGL